jgi:ligand-binding sensor domain-containing protein
MLGSRGPSNSQKDSPNDFSICARGGRVFSVIADRDASVWLGTSDGLNRWNRGQITVYRKRNGHLGAQRLPESIPRTAVREIRDDGLPDDSFESVFQDDRGRSWVSTPRWVAYFEDGRFKPVGSGCVSPLLSENAVAKRIIAHKRRIAWCGPVWASVGQQHTPHRSARGPNVDPIKAAVTDRKQYPP